MCYKAYEKKGEKQNMQLVPWVTHQMHHEHLDSKELFYIYSFLAIPFMEWYAFDHGESISVVLKPLNLPWIRIFLKNCRTCSLKCDITPEDMFSVSETCPIHSAQYCCDLSHKPKCYSLVYV